MDGFATKFLNNIVPIFNEIKEDGSKVYIRSTRKYEDGVIPNAVWVPGLTGQVKEDLWQALYEFDSDDHESITTVLFTDPYLDSEGWVEL